MNQEKEEQQIIGLEEFDQYVSLANIIPGGNGSDVALLKRIADALQFDEYNGIVRTPRILIHGKEPGKSTLGKAFINYLCLETRQIDAGYFQNLGHFVEFFHAGHIDRAYIITNIENLPLPFYKAFFQILFSRSFIVYNYEKRTETIYPVGETLILTSEDRSRIPSKFLSYIDYTLSADKTTVQKKQLVVMQRLKNMGMTYTDQSIREMATESVNIKALIDLLRICIDIVKSECRNNLMVKDVELAKKLM